MRGCLGDREPRSPRFPVTWHVHAKADSLSCMLSPMMLTSSQGSPEQCQATYKQTSSEQDICAQHPGSSSMASWQKCLQELRAQVHGGSMIVHVLVLWTRVPCIEGAVPTPRSGSEAITRFHSSKALRHCRTVHMCPSKSASWRASENPVPRRSMIT